jgi:beta-glucosidase
MPFSLLLFMACLSVYAKPFAFGAASSAHQAEGKTGGAEHGDWYGLEHAGSGAIFANDDADVAVDFWQRYDEDFALAEDMGLDSVRISIAWEKVEPEPGRFDVATLAHYRDILRSMHAHHLTPLVALHHFTHPQWFVETGGFAGPRAPFYFARYVAAVTAALDDLCDAWITFNEPNISVHLGYVTGQYPPRERNVTQAVKAAFGFVFAHRGAVRWIHGHAERASAPLLPGAGDSVGLVQSLQIYAPLSPKNPLHHALAAVLEWLADWLWLDIEHGRTPLLAAPSPNEKLDWLGVNYYGRFFVAFPKKPGPGRCPPGERVADNGWCLYPQGLRAIVEATHARYPDVPLLVGENGLADGADALRPQILRESLAALDETTAPVHGYYHWSLTDNFEWLHGYRYRFGLIGIDRDLVRHPRASAWIYRDEIRKRRESFGLGPSDGTVTR